MDVSSKRDLQLLSGDKTGKEDQSETEAPGNKDKKESNHAFKIMSANANSLKNKMSSLRFNISMLKPQVVVIQETKIKRKSQIDLAGILFFESQDPVHVPVNFEHSLKEDAP